MIGKPLEIAVVGAGHRSVAYAQYALSYPDRMKVVAVADPDSIRRNALADAHNISAKNRFVSFEDLAARPRLADAVINGTMDKMHYASALPFLQQGYHMLLEKPIAPSQDEVESLIETARRHHVTVMICHVLRYAPFYAAIKERLVAGEIGEIISLHTSERVSYHHMATGFIRGRWNNTATSNPMLLSKCCHDLDLIAWFFSQIAVRRVASFGSLKQFRPENAPPGSALRCLDGCKIEPECPYSARAIYIEKNLWEFYAWESIEHLSHPTVEQKLESLKIDNPFGRCVWHCDNDVVDHQSVLIEFENGATATHDMFCATAKPDRDIHIVGTKGEIEGSLEEETFVIRHPAPHRAEGLFDEETIFIGAGGDGGGHGGGDGRLVEDFVNVLSGDAASRGVTRIEDSLTGHRIAFAADIAMREHRVVEFGAC